MKKKLSLLLALAMMLSVPMSSFAASSNSVDKVPQVTDDYKFTSNAPNLRVEEKNNDEFGAAGQTFRMKLENGEWLDQGLYAKDTVNTATAANGTTVYVKRLTNTTVEATVYGDDTDSNKDAFFFPMEVEVQGKGDVKVTVDSLDSAVTGGTYTFATAAGGNTVATIDSAVTFTDIGNLKVIEIQETKVGSLSGDDAGEIKLKLPSNFKWNTAPAVTTSGGLSTATGTAAIDPNSDRTLIITMDYEATATATRGSVFLTGAKIEADSSASYGDVEVTITGDSITSEDLLVANYDDYAVEVKADGEPKELVSGVMSGYGDDDHKLQTLVIKENVDGSWISNRKTRVEFPSWVKVLGADIVSGDTENIDTTNISTGAFSDKGDNYVEFTAPEQSGKGALYVKFYVSVEAGHAGDITATVSGRSIGEEFEVVLGTAVNPISVKADGANVRVGVKNQPIGDITITENVKEGIAKGSLEVVLDENVEWKEVPTIEVTDGNIDLDVEGAKVDGNVLTIPVDSDSSKPATIVISDAELDLDRTVAEGDIDVKVGGNAVVRNNYVSDDAAKELKDGFFKEDFAGEAVAAAVITPADGNTKAGVEVKFVIGEASYQVGDETKTADVAPYITDGRTMLSLRYVAEAMGVAESDILWNEASRTVTIFKGDRIAQVEIGSNKLYVNGTMIPMDTVAVIKDGRTMLPIRFIAQALGADIQWDGEARTVTVK